MKQTILASLLVLATAMQAQEISKQGTFTFESLKKYSYLGNIFCNAEDGTTSLQYAKQLPTATLFSTYVFDENLNFVEELKEKYEAEEQSLDEAIEEIKEGWSWFTNKYKGETYTEDRITIYQDLGGKIGAKKYRYTYAYSWNIGHYEPKTELLETIKIKGEDAERLYLHDWIQSYETGEAFLIVGMKAPKKSKIKNQQHRNFQIVKITQDFKVEYLEEIKFDYDMTISFKQVVSTEPLENTYTSEEEVLFTDDISKGKWLLSFAPAKMLFGKKTTKPDARRYTIVSIDKSGKIENRIECKVEMGGWLIEDYLMSDDAKDIYLYGPAKAVKYANEVQTSIQTAEDMKWSNFQILKISNNQLAWVSNTNIKEFKTKAISPPSQRQKPTYTGKRFAKTAMYLTPAGEIFIAGQKYTKKIQNEVPVTEYRDLVMFHFDNKGALKAQYGVRRDRMNRHAKRALTPQDMYLSADGTALYWIYGEIKGLREGFGFDILDSDIGTISKRKLLYYPAVAKIDMADGNIGDFQMMGQDKNGKQRYYTHPDFSQVLSPDGNALTFVGEDKSGKVIWLGRMEL